MKKPDEIKKGMECCDFDHWQGRKCEQCPYMNADDEWCKSMDEIRNDTLALIQQLEAQVPKWISVENPPKEAGEYIVLIRYPDGRSIRTYKQNRRTYNIPKVPVWQKNKRCRNCGAKMDGGAEA